MTHHGLDTDTHVYFYEQDFYPFSNFSSFRLLWREMDFDTAEHAYQWAKFDAGPLGVPDLAGRLAIRASVRTARSAHDAFIIARANQDLIRPDWSEIRVATMHEILRAKTAQHSYVRRKLDQTGDRILVENSWRDGFWGWGANGDGHNMLGKLWMEVRAEIRRESAILQGR